MPNPPLSVRFQVLLRDQNSCVNCSRKAEEGAQLSVQHITPSAAGGKSNLHNLHTLCIECTRLLSVRKRVFSPLNSKNIVPPNYALGIFQEAMRNLQRKMRKSELSFEEAHLAANSRELISAIVNPLYFPLPRSAVIAAAVALHQEGKLKVEGKLIKL